MQLLLLEDDSSVAQFVRQALTNAGFTVLTAGDIPDAQACLKNQDFDCLILDRSLPSGDALHWASLFTQEDCPPILFLTAKDSLQDKLEGLSVGDDYLVKPFAVDELIARVRALIRRRAKSENLLQAAGIQLNRIQRSVTRGTYSIELKPMEFKLLEYLMLHKGQRVSRQMLLEHVWEYSFEPTTTIVETYISRLRAKLDVPNMPQAILTERGAGYTIADD